MAAGIPSGQQGNPFDRLPPETVQEIFKFLPNRVLNGVGAVCRRFREAADEVWRHYRPLENPDNENINVLFQKIRIGEERQLSLDQLARALIAASKFGRMDIVDKIMGSERFPEIPVDALGQALIDAFLQGHEALVDKIIFVLPVHALGQILIDVSYRGYEALVHRIMNSARFREIPAPAIGQALIYTSWEGHEAALRRIIESGRFQDISESDLGSALERAASGGHAEIINMFIRCNRFSEIAMGTLFRVRAFASAQGHQHIVAILQQQIDIRNARADAGLAPDTE